MGPAARTALAGRIERIAPAIVAALHNKAGFRSLSGVVSSLVLWSGQGPRYSAGMLTLSCLCSQVRIELANPPEFIHECNCTLCTKTGARWAYFHPSQLTVEGATNGYCRADKDEPAADVRFCPNCGSTTHFVLTESAASKFGNSLAGVNMRLVDEGLLAGIELRYPNGRAWSGAGEFGYVRAAEIIGGSAMSE